ncbi:MAG: pyridoxal-phosphate dependent enzyme, partial [Chloroflexota bacterium]
MHSMPSRRSLLSSQILVECLDCGHLAPYYPTAYSCPRCDSQWREARYDFDTISRTLLALLPGRPFDLWRYRELLPVRNPNVHVSMGEGGTPLFHAANLGMMLGCPHIYIKDERQGPTSSFKDRQAAVGVMALKEAGINEVVLASTGNVAISYSAYAARAGIKLWAFLTSLVPAEKMREVAIYGTQVVKVTASYDQAKQVAAEFARQRGLYLERGARSIPSLESMKTIAFEIAEQLTEQLGPQSSTHSLRAPDWYFQSVSGGLGPLGVQKGFDELLKMNWVEKMPSMGIIQAEGCAPMVHAWKQGLEIADPIRSPRTHIATLATGDPGRVYTLLYQRMQQDGG